MNKYVKKPVVVEAIQWTGKNLLDVTTFYQNGVSPTLNCDMPRAKWSDYHEYVIKNGLSIITLEGVMKASIGDYIIKGVNGEFYPCKPDIFNKTYKPYNESEHKKVIYSDFDELTVWVMFDRSSVELISNDDIKKSPNSSVVIRNGNNDILDWYTAHGLHQLAKTDSLDVKPYNPVTTKDLIDKGVKQIIMSYVDVSKVVNIDNGVDLLKLVDGAHSVIYCPNATLAWYKFNMNGGELLESAVLVKTL